MEILKDPNNQNYIKDTNPYEKFEKIDNDSSKEEYNGYWYTYLET